MIGVLSTSLGLITMPAKCRNIDVMYYYDKYLGLLLLLTHSKVVEKYGMTNFLAYFLNFTAFQ